MHGASTGGRLLSLLPVSQRGICSDSLVWEAQSVGQGGWYWRGPHYKRRSRPHVPDVASALANAGLGAFGDAGPVVAPDAVMHPFPGAYLDNVEEDGGEEEDVEVVDHRAFFRWVERVAAKPGPIYASNVCYAAACVRVPTERRRLQRDCRATISGAETATRGQGLTTAPRSCRSTICLCCRRG